MQRRSFLFRALAFLASCGVFPRSLRAWAQKQVDDQATPAALARASFAALQRQDLAKFVALFHPEALAQFKAFACEVFKQPKEDREIEQLRDLFAPLDTQAEVEAAGEAEIMSAFLKSSMAKIEGLAEILAGLELQILGEIPEGPDKVHVITRTALRPSPVTCQKLEGRWYQHLNDDQLRLIRALRQKQHFRGKDVTKIQQQMTVESVDVLGHVPDGAATAQVLCRTHSKIDDFAFSVFACYPVRKGEPAWELLDGDEAKLVEALLAKWQKVDQERNEALRSLNEM